MAPEGVAMDTMTITIESDSGTRMKFLVHHEPHFDLRSEEVDGLETKVRTVENTITREDDGRMFLALAQVTLDSIIEALSSASEGDE
jgi:hypothetical protein